MQILFELIKLLLMAMVLNNACDTQPLPGTSCVIETSEYRAYVAHSSHGKDNQLVWFVD